MTKTSSASTLVRGGSGSFTLAVANTGGVATDGTTVTVADTLPAGLTPGSATGTNWTCGTSSQTVTCTSTSVVNGGASFNNITVPVTVASNAGASLTNRASVVGGGDTTSDTGSVTVSTVDPINLTMTKTSSAATLIRGGTGSFTLAVANTGGVATDGTTVTVADTLPTGLTPGSATGTNWTCSTSSQTVTCTSTSVVNGGSSFNNITVPVTVALNASASLTNTASVVGGGDTTAATSSATVSTVDPINVTITKTSSAATFVRG